MVVCEICGGNCDHGELVQGICPECWEMREKKKSQSCITGKNRKRQFFCRWN